MDTGMIQEVMSTLNQMGAPEWLLALVAILGPLVLAANTITALLPTRLQGVMAFMNPVNRILNVLAMNIGRNKNADDRSD